MHPRISVVIVAKNSKAILMQCLERLRRQNYDRSLIEILVIDGGSTDGTQEVSRTFGARVIDGGYPDNQEARRYVGAKLATGEILLYLDADNLIPYDTWLLDMVSPFERSQVVASFTKWYDPDKFLPSIDRYYALLGGNDPVVYYFGKHDRVPYGESYLPKGAKSVSIKSGCEIVRFSPKQLPTVGCNGFLVRKAYFDLLDLQDPEQFFHTDVHIDLLTKNPDAEYAIVDNTIIHASGGTLLTNLRKRLRYKSEHSERLHKYRRYHIFDPSCWRDKLRLLYIAAVAGTFIIPFLRATVGFFRTGRWEWFWHPAATFGMVVAYGIALIVNKKRGRA
jgi:glycosyltransferase involved in cell wall biosynthesis